MTFSLTNTEINKYQKHPALYDYNRGYYRSLYDFSGNEVLCFNDTHSIKFRIGYINGYTEKIMSAYSKEEIDNFNSKLNCFKSIKTVIKFLLFSFLETIAITKADDVPDFYPPDIIGMRTLFNFLNSKGVFL